MEPRCREEVRRVVPFMCGLEDLVSEDLESKGNNSQKRCTLVDLSFPQEDLSLELTL